MRDTGLEKLLGGGTEKETFFQVWVFDGYLRC